MTSTFKIFADPVHGFISVPEGLIMELVQSPEVQRLRRIRQLGVGFLVFSGAEHSRFGHALGAMALMSDALRSISQKGTPVSPAERESAMAAALLHDIGHGPFSHTLERDLIEGLDHEDVSRELISRLNDRLDGRLDLALSIFDGSYDRPFFHALVSSQLDMDRLDYLRRDSFYTGVAEGVVGVERLIKTLSIYPLEGGLDSRIVLQSKGSYAVESFIIARRLMYWQVYLHKTVLAGDHLLRSIFERVRSTIKSGTYESLGASETLEFFLRKPLVSGDLKKEGVLDRYCELDDTDLLFSIKRWMKCSDPVLADLCRRFIDRDFLRVSILDKEPSRTQIEAWKDEVQTWLGSAFGVDQKEAAEIAGLYFLAGSVSHAAYNADDGPIFILDAQGRPRTVSETADIAGIAALSVPVRKPFVCYPKALGASFQV